MAKELVRLLVASSTCGIVSLVFLLVGFGTDYWISSDVTIGTFVGNVNYGLFTGRYDRNSLQDIKTYDLTIVCSFSDNVCFWSCLSSDDDRTNELNNLLNTGTSPFACQSLASAQVQPSPKRKAEPADFQNAGLWVALIFFLSVSTLFNAVGLGFNVYNVFRNPIEFYAGIRSIQIYYGVAAFATLMVLILWGVEYAVYISDNLAILDTLTSDGVTSSTMLQYSYFVLLISLFGKLTAIGLLSYREYRIKKAESKTVVRVDDATNNASTFMY